MHRLYVRQGGFVSPPEDVSMEEFLSNYFPSDDEVVVGDYAKLSVEGKQTIYRYLSMYDTISIYSSKDVTDSKLFQFITSSAKEKIASFTNPVMDLDQYLKSSKTFSDAQRLLGGLSAYDYLALSNVRSPRLISFCVGIAKYVKG